MNTLNADHRQGTSINSFLAGILVIVFALGGSLLSFYIIHRLNKLEQEIKEPPISSTALEQVVVNPLEPTDFQKYQELIKSGNFVELPNMPMYSPKFSVSSVEENNRIANQFLTNEFRKVALPVGRKIIEGYLFLKVSAGDGMLSNKESVYVYLKDGTHGGHLMKSKSLISDPKLTGQYLYKLNAMPLTTIPYSDDNPYIEKNWLSLLNAQNYNYFGGFVSTVRGGKIEKVVFAFE